MSTRLPDLPVRSRALLSLAINAALALGWNAAKATPHQVANCNTAGPGSLSAVIADPATVDGDVVDMTSLKNVCSKISVNALAIHQDNLYLQGPGAKYLTIDGGDNGLVFRHVGNGTLVIAGLTVANGSYSGAIEPAGACVNSTGSVSLIDSRVSDCAVKSTSSTDARGGAIYTAGNLHLLRSTISGSRAEGTGVSVAIGGGAFVKGDFTLLYSTISDNTAIAVSGSAYGYAGGVQVMGNVDIENSTISGNSADVVGALAIAGGAAHVATIINSTISSNVGTNEFGGAWTNESLTLRNSTIAFNRSPLGAAGRGDGLYAGAMPLLASTIISGNSGHDGPNDLGGIGMTPTSHNNLIGASPLMLPVGTIRDCPKLDVLADNGGPTLTHLPNATSEAIDKGSQFMAIDQRLAPRVTGPQADIGAVEWRPSDKPERVLASGFDGLCDQ